MKKIIKGTGLSLCAMLLLAGCSGDKEADTKANISNPDDVMFSGLKEDVKSLTLQELYDELKAAKGNEIAANKLLETIADLVLSDTTWKARYDAKIAEKLEELEKSAEYKDANGVFDEELLVKTLNSAMYNITCEQNNYGPTYKQDGSVDKYRICNYDNYIEKALKLDALTELLKEKYIYDKVIGVDNKDILTTKKARLVEYITINYSGSDTSDEYLDTEEEVIAFIKENITELAKTDSTLTLKGIADKWTEREVAEVDDKFSRIGTKRDKDGKYYEDFTKNFTQSIEKGREQMKQAVYDTKYYDRVVITNDSKDILNATLVERILSENVLSSTSGKTIPLNGSYYLVAPRAYQNATSSDIRIKDSTNSKYYIVKVDVIKNDSNDDLKYEAVKVLAQNATLVSDSLEYYLEQYKDEINIHDEEIYNYLKAQYADIFVD